MSDDNLPVPAENRNPLVSIEQGVIFTDTLRIARDFDRQHKNVLQAIQNLECSEDFIRRNFQPVSYADAKGEQRPMYTMTRKGFSFLVMGFTGSKAALWKEKYIDAFELAYEELANRAKVPDLSDPRQLLKLLNDYANKAVELQDKVEEMMPSVHALNRIALSDGALCITDAAKSLQVSRTKLFAYLREKRWIYKRPENEADIAFQDKINAGLLEHKVHVIQKKDGGELTRTQVRITPKGLARLGKELANR